MKYIKYSDEINEEFLNFFKNKNNKPTLFLDIYSCLSDILDERRLNCDLVNYVDGIFHREEDIISKNKKITFLIGTSDFPSLEIYENELTFRLMRNRRNMPDNELIEILLDVEDKLKVYNCKISFFRSWGFDEGGCDDKEYKSVDSLSKLPLWNLTVKITAPVNIDPSGLKPIGKDRYIII